MDNNSFIGKKEPILKREEMFTHIKQDISEIFHETNLGALTNARDIGFLDLNPLNPQKIPTEYDETRSASDIDYTYSKPNLKFMANMYPPPLFLQGAYSPLQTRNNLEQFPNYIALKDRKQSSEESFPGLISKLQIRPRYEDYGHIMEDYSFLDNYSEDPLSAMWNNDSGKPQRQRISTPDTALRARLNPVVQKSFITPAYYQDEDEDNYPRNNLHQIIVKQEGAVKYPIQNQIKIEPEMSKLFNKKNEEEPGSRHSSNLSTTDGKTPTKKGQTPSKSSGKSSIQRNARVIDDDDDDEPENKARSSRGLRVLSLKVKDIVSEKKRTSYKEVAETLIQDISHKLRAKGDSASKEEQNVKRRVYDALNVLIAADILKKDGKAVSCDDSISSLGANKRKKMKEEKEKLEREIQEVRRKNKAKVDMLQELVFKLLAIKNLIRRNHEAKEAEQKAKSSVKTKKIENKFDSPPPSNPAFNPNKDDIIQFPFIVVLSSSSENSVRYEILFNLQDEFEYGSD